MNYLVSLLAYMTYWAAIGLVDQMCLLAGAAGAAHSCSVAASSCVTPWAAADAPLRQGSGESGPDGAVTPGHDAPPSPPRLGGLGAPPPKGSPGTHHPPLQAAPS